MNVLKKCGSDHFADVGKMVPIGSGSKRSFKGYQLSRYAKILAMPRGK